MILPNQSAMYAGVKKGTAAIAILASGFLTAFFNITFDIRF